MSSDVGEKARAVFLAALMVLSVVAMTTAFAGSAAAAANTLSVTQDAVDDGQSISGTFQVDSTDTDVQIVLDVGQDGNVESAITVPASEIDQTDTDIEFSGLTVPEGAIDKGAGDTTADVVVVQQSSAFSSGDSTPSGEDSTTVNVNHAADDELVVDGDDGEGEYGTISAALSDADAQDEIVVQEQSGTYGAFTVDESVTITAASGANPVVEASGAGQGIIVIQGGNGQDGITLSGLTIRDSDTSNDDTGVFVELGTSELVTIESNNFENLKTGVQTATGGTGSVEVSGNTFTGQVDIGVSIQGDRGAVVESNTFESTTTDIGIAVGNGPNDASVGVEAIRGNDINIDSKATDLGFLPVGIDITEGSVDEVTDNTVSGPTGIDDVRVEGTGPVTSLDGNSDINAQVTYLINNNDITTTNPYAVEVTPTDVTVGNEETVEITILGRDSNNPRVTNVPFQILDADGDDVVADSKSSSNSFPTLVGFNEVGDYEVVFDGETGTPTETITSTYAVANFETDPVDPAFSDTVTLSGQVVNGAGDGVDAGSLDLININDDNTEQVSGFASTTAGGNFSGVVNVDDAATYAVGQGSDIFAEFTVDSQQANVTLTAGGNEAGFEQTYEITLKDGSGNQLDFDSVNGFVNVTGPFDDGETISLDGAASSGLQEIDSDDTDDVVEAVRIQPDAGNEDESISLTATPVDTDSDVTASLENNGPTNEITDLDATVYGGAEDTSITTYDAPDYVGSDSLAVTSAGNLNVDVNQDEVAALDGGSQFDISIRGVDGNFPDGTGDDSDALDTASVSITGPGIDLSEEEFNSGTADDDLTDAATVDADNNEIQFTGVEADQAGTITIDVTAVADDGTEYSDTLTVDVTGDIVESVSPTDAQIDDNENVTVQVTNADGTVVNNRVVELANSDGATLTVYNQEDSETLTGVTTLTIDGAAGEITASGGDADGSAIVTGISVNNGEYTAQNITFSATGSFDVTVATDPTDIAGTANAQQTGAISVTGLEAYEITSNRSAALAGAEEVHTLNITEDGVEVNGTALDDFSVTSSAADTTATGLTPVDLDEDGTNDALEVTVTATNASAMANVTLGDGTSRTGKLSLDVVEPEITTTLGGDALTFGLTSELNVTVEDPRTGEGIDTTVDVDAVNATYDFDNDLSDDTIDLSEVEGPSSVDVNENGTQAIAVAPEAGTADAAPQTLNLSVSLDTMGGAFGETAIETGNITIDGVPEDLEPNSDVSPVLNIGDANNNAIDLIGVEISGPGLDGEDRTKLTDEGFVNFDITTSDSGTISYNVASSSAVGVIGGSITVASTNVFEQVNLSLSANATDIEPNGSVEFELVREDFNQLTSGTLTITNASGNVVETVSIDDAGTANVSFDEAGEFIVESSKPTRTQVGKAFVNDTVDVIVEDEQEATAQTSVTFDDKTVTNGTEEVTVDSANFTLADGSAGDYVVVVHTIDEFGAPVGNVSPPIGASDDLTGAEENITVDLTAVDGPINSLTENVTLRAMLHTTANDSAFGTRLGSDDAAIDGIEPGDETDDANITVEDPAEFQLSGLDPTEETVQQGDEIDVSVTVTNEGDLEGTQNVTLSIGENEVDEQVTLGAGENTTVSFDNVSTSAIDAPANVTYTVSTDDADVSGNLTVERGLATYQDENGDTSIDQLRDAITDFRNDDIGIDLLRGVIDSFRESQ